MDANGTEALTSALTGDFTVITGSPAGFAGIRLLDSALSVTTTQTHTIALHLLGIFNCADANTFVQNSKIDYTKDTKEIVLSDQTISVATNSLNATSR